MQVFLMSLDSEEESSLGDCAAIQSHRSLVPVAYHVHDRKLAAGEIRFTWKLVITLLCMYMYVQ